VLTLAALCLGMMAPFGVVFVEPAPAAPRATPPRNVADSTQRGKASWYGRAFHGRRTATGEIYDMNRLTAAHPRLPLGSRVRVTNLKNGRSVTVRVNDRGPVVPGRVIDLSYEAARKLDAVSDGTIPVVLHLLATPPSANHSAGAS
jgi:rare lipoprotein A